MLPSRFRHHRPVDLPSALELLARHGDEASPIAGGTELLVALKSRILRYEHLVDLKRIPCLGEIRQEGGRLILGGLASHFRLAADPLVRRLLPAYARLSNDIGNIRVRVAGTIGGNLCFAEPHADPPAMLCALGASVVLVGPEGERSVAVEEFIEGEFTTVRAEDEILTAVSVPLPPDGAAFAYASFGHLERPAVGIAVGILPAGDEGGRYRIWAGAICDRPTRLATVEAALADVPPAALGDVLAEAAREGAAALETHDDLHGSADYKQHLAGVLIRRAVAEAAATASRFGATP